jgi:hypothetical protein
MQATRYNIGDWKPEQYSPIKQSPFDVSKSNLISNLQSEVSRLKPQGDIRNLDPRNQQYLAASTMLAKAKQKLENMPWDPSMKRTLGASEGVSLLQESGGDMVRLEGITRSDYEAARNKFGDYDERTKALRNKLDQISQFNFYADKEPEWKRIINPPQKTQPQKKMSFEEMFKFGTKSSR